MAVTKLCESYGRQYTSAVTGQSSATRIYYAFCNTDYDELTDLVRDAVAAGLPDLGDAFGSDSGETLLVVTEHVPREVEKELRFYQIEVKYQSNQIIFSTPTNRIWDINFSSVMEEYVPDTTKFSTVPIYNDSAYTGPVRSVAAGRWITNNVGIPFDPPPTDLRNLVRITLKKNFASLTNIGSVTGIDDLMSYTNAVNDDDLTIAGLAGGKFSFWMEDIQANNTVEDGFNYYAVTFTILYDPDLHILKILNAGYQQNNPKDPKKIITIPGGENGGSLNSPWPLDKDGFAIKGDTYAIRAAKAVYYGFGVKPTKTFADLSLPTAFNFS